MPEMRIIHPGPFTTVQDLGRTQSQVAGFPASGVFWIVKRQKLAMRS